MLLATTLVNEAVDCSDCEVAVNFVTVSDKVVDFVREEAVDALSVTPVEATPQSKETQDKDNVVVETTVDVADC